MVAVNLIIILSLCQFQKINLLYKIQKNTEYSVICLHCIVVSKLLIIIKIVIRKDVAVMTENRIRELRKSQQYVTRSLGNYN